MRTEIQFGGDRIELEVEDDRLVADLSGPTGLDVDDLAARLAAALADPLDFPPLQDAVVPGDRVVLAVDPALPEPSIILEALANALRGRYGDDVHITALIASASGAGAAAAEFQGPRDVEVVRHDPEDRESIAYLASTAAGRRIYLNRLAVDADFLIAVGAFRHDPAVGTLGPSATLFPGLADASARRDVARAPRPNDAESERVLFDEGDEVGGLIGAQFCLGVIEGSNGVADVLAGLSESVSEQGLERLEAAWSRAVAATAEVVIAGVGAPGRPGGLAEVARGLTQAARLVRPGGKVVLLSRAEIEPGPALDALARLDDPRAGARALRAFEKADDYPHAVAIAAAAAHADVFLHAGLEDDLVEGLGMIPLRRPEQARAIAAAAASVATLSRAESLRVAVIEQSEPAARGAR